MEDKILNQVVPFAKKTYGKLELIQKKLKNRTPDGVKNFVGKFILPYMAIFLIGGFVLAANFAHAAENTNFMVSDEVMDLEPAEVANVVNSVSTYTPIVQADPIQVALAMQNNDFVEKPKDVFETVITEQPKEVTAPVVRKSTTNYVVKDGDTLSSIGWTYGLKIATIKATNNLTSDSIKPGQTLKLPTADLSPAAIKLAADKASKKKVAGAKTVNRAPGSSNNAYPYGWCTYYVATRRYVPAHWGDAKSWLSSAQRAGYSTGREPAAGAIVVTTESWWGHVAYVESVHGDSITISEMNAVGWGIKSSRVLSAHASKIRGYIY
ncbi:TPA: hypothetical protein DD449_00975 [Candidatus Berkelbacteria bacterium]|uniref:CHAP domain-containing protein n=1 Tax=Berkelbacteria bacterium GW2011_GWE1_39_12 TaxID=1618337 RepID=A0A0G4B461_9BACT|nr:MAG: hypothetical protein UT28_C0001G0892 [Berkelbacteria bacterium GW2011_GWE1_39_12]HBO60244.1 hypothetical protein [Candidatus Berkelbacteria bacterium]